MEVAARDSPAFLVCLGRTRSAYPRPIVASAVKILVRNLATSRWLVIPASPASPLGLSDCLDCDACFKLFASPPKALDTGDARLEPPE